MADPITMVAVGATIAGGAVTAFGQKKTGEAEKAMYDYRAAVAKQNAIYERAIGERRTAELGLKQAQRMGQITAGQGASGIDVGSESSQRVRTSQHAVDLIEQQDVREGAARKAYGEETQSTIYTAAGKQAEWAGDVSATGTVLGTIGSVASKWYQGKSVGLGYGGGGIDTGIGLSPFGGSTLFG